MARRKPSTRTAAAPSTAGNTLSCGCVRQGVVDRGHHGRDCTGWPYPRGCDSLDCDGACLVTAQSCDGDGDE